jgi:peptide/nickel transport system permease protein
VRHLYRFFSRWQNGLGFLLVLFFVLVALAAPLLSPMDPKDPGVFKKVGHTRTEKLDIAPHPPSDIAPLGTLPNQYSVYHTIVWGSRDALRFGLIVVLLSGLFGIVWGAGAGFAGGAVNTVLMRVADAFLAFPMIAGVVFLQQLMAISVQAAGGFYVFNFNNRGPLINIVGEVTPIQVLLGYINPVMLSLILFLWMPYARMTNSIVISLKNTEFIHASRALGSSSIRTVLRHIIPNSLAPSVVLMARDVGGIIILQATLTFIQLGGDSPWGDILSQGRSFLINIGSFRYWWVYLPATVAVMLFAIAWNLLGDGLNDLLDPTAVYDFDRSPLWRRIFSRQNRQTVPEAEPVSILDVSLQPLPSMPAQDTMPLHKLSYSDGTDPLLLAARDDVARGNLPGALHAYQHLMRHGRMVQEILPDLAQLVQANPRDPLVWQLLGDALTQEGDIIHARQSYEKARKLRQ